MSREPLRTPSGKSSEAAAQDNLISIMNEALEEIVLECFSRPGKLLTVARYVKNDNNFVIVAQAGDDFFHHTLLYLENISKGLGIQVIVEHCSSVGGVMARRLGDEQGVMAVDKAMGGKGVKQIVCISMGVSMRDHVPKHGHYKPLLKDLSLKRMRDQDVELKFTESVATDLSECGVFKLASLQDVVYHKLEHRKSGVDIDIPEDYTVRDDCKWCIENNHSWDTACLRGRRANESVIAMLKEAKVFEHVSYDPKTHMNETAEALYISTHGGDIERKRRSSAVQQESGMVALGNGGNPCKTAAGDVLVAVEDGESAPVGSGAAGGLIGL